MRDKLIAIEFNSVRFQFLDSLLIIDFNQRHRYTTED